MSTSADTDFVSKQRNRGLIAYAFLAQASRVEGDLMSGLMPIFKPIAKLHEGQKFEPAEFAKDLGDVYGLDVNPWAIEDLIPRLEKAGLIARFRLTDELHEYRYSKIDEEFGEIKESDLRALVDYFVEFATPLLKDRNEPLDRNMLENALFDQLVNPEFLGIVLKPVDKRERGSTLTMNKRDEQDEWDESTIERSKMDVLCASFILDAYNNYPEFYELIVRVANGALLSEVVLNLQDPGATIELKDLVVVLDTPFLMALLDLSNEKACSAATAIAVQLKAHGAELAVFSHSVDELKDNLKAAISSVESGRGHGSTARRLEHGAFNKYAKSVLHNPIPRLKQEAIREINPPTSASSLQFYSESDEELFFNSLGVFDNNLAQERDAQSIAAIMRLRAGRKAKVGNLPKTKYIFLTSNAWLAQKSQEVLARQRVLSQDEVPPAISDKYIAGLLWVLYGGVAKEIPRQVLLANCAAALEPRSDIITKMHAFLSQLDDKKAEYFKVLMSEERGGQYLMQLTLGDSHFLTDENASVVLEAMKKSLIEKHEAETARKLEDLNDSYEAQARELQEKIDNLQERELTITSDLQSAEEVVDRLSATLEKEEKRKILKAIHTVDRNTGRLTLVIGILMGGITAIAAHVAGQLNPKSNVTYLLAAISGVIVFVGFWRIPDMWLTKAMNRYRELRLKKLLAAEGLADFNLSVDWEQLTYTVDETTPRMNAETG